MNARRSVLNIASSLEVKTKDGEIGLVLCDAGGRAIVTYWLPLSDALAFKAALDAAIARIEPING